MTPEDRQGAARAVREVAGNPEALRMMVAALGEATGKNILLVGQNVYGTMDEEEVAHIAGALGASLNVGVILVPDHTRELMVDLAEVMEPVINLHNAAVAEARTVEAVHIRDMGYRLNLVHLRTLAQTDEQVSTWYPEARGGITVATVMAPDRQVGIGVSFCHPLDQYRKRSGANQAIRRAMSALAGKGTFCGVAVSEAYLRDVDFHSLQDTMTLWTVGQVDTHNGVVDDPDAADCSEPFATWRSPWSCKWYLRASPEKALGQPRKGAWAEWGGMEFFVHELVHRALGTLEDMPEPVGADKTNTPGLVDPPDLEV